MRVDRRKRGTGNIYKGTPDIEFEQDVSGGLGAILADGQKIKNYFFSFRDFLGKAGVILLGFKCTINTQNLIKIIRAIFEKMKILNFFFCELPLILGVDRKRKNELKIIARGP